MFLEDHETDSTYSSDDDDDDHDEMAKSWASSKHQQHKIFRPARRHRDMPSLCRSYRLRVVLFSSMTLCACFASQASMTSAMVCMFDVDDDDRAFKNDQNNILFTHNIHGASTTVPNQNNVRHSAHNSSIPQIYQPNDTINKTPERPNCCNIHRLSPDNKSKDGVLNATILGYFAKGINDRSSKSTEHNEWKLCWSVEIRGWVISAFFVGYYFMQIPSGIIVTRLGPKSTLAIAIAAAGVSNLLTVPAARFNNMVLVYLFRLLAGMACGCILPGTYALVANWCPARESSFLLGVTGGGIELGNTVSFTLALFGCEYDLQGGWPIIFHALGCWMVIMALIMCVFITDFPSDNKYIHPREAKYIDGNRAHDSIAKSIPFRRCLKSPPVWALVIAQLGVDCMYYTLIIQGPRFLRDVIKLPPWKTNLLGSLPFLIVIPVFLTVNYACDKAIQHKLASKTSVRKFNQLYFTVFTAIPIFFFGYIPEGAWGKAFAIYILAAIGVTGTYAGYMANPGDLSPAHAGFLTSLGQTMSMWVAFVIPAFTGYVTQQKDRHSWHVVFGIVVGVEVCCCIFYMIFASGDLQPWASVGQKGEDEEREIPLLGRENDGGQNKL